MKNEVGVIDPLSYWDRTLDAGFRQLHEGEDHIQTIRHSKEFKIIDADPGQDTIAAEFEISLDAVSQNVLSYTRQYYQDRHDIDDMTIFAAYQMTDDYGITMTILDVDIEFDRHPNSNIF